MTTDVTTTVPPQSTQSQLEKELRLGDGWTFVPATGGFVKSKPFPLPSALQELYEKQNTHTR